MAIFKCKMCGGTLDINPGDSIAVCDYCGTKQTLPKLDDDKRANMYDRANHFRRNNEYDKAMGIYEQILNEDNTDAEAYWSIVLCRYGIEYVEDPATHTRIPTVNRAQYTSVFDDDNYKSALQYASAAQHDIYVQEATAINEIQKGILAISQKEEPFDVFICYKETDKDGRRTPDSVLANDLYHQLTNEGFKVFFSRITLEDKLGTAYEPYIFAALNSAKVMVVLGTKPEYFNAVWVKNEWSRYLSLIKNGANKILIPAYRDMDPYDLPEEFSHLQAQDMSKLGFMQDLIRGIKKLTEDTKPETVVKETKVISESASVAPLLKRTALFLEDGNWQEADQYCERVLDLDPENAQAYLYKLMAKLRVRTKEALRDCNEPFDNEDSYRKTLRFADKALAEELEEANAYIKEKKEEARKESIYSYALSFMKKANDEKTFKSMARDFGSISGYKDSDSLKKQCEEKAEECRRRAEEIIAEQKRIEEEKRIAAEKRKKKNIRIGIITAISAVVCAAIALVTVFVIIPPIKYSNAMMEMENDNLDEAIAIFTELGDFSDSTEKIKEAKYRKAIVYAENGEYLDAIKQLINISGYKDSSQKIVEFSNEYMPVGSVVTMGEYDGKPIEWIVLEYSDNSLGRLLLCKDSVDDRAFNYIDEAGGGNWGESSIRDWLNSSFFNDAFSEEEQQKIQRSYVVLPDNDNDKTWSGLSELLSTYDKVFLLSPNEFKRYSNIINDRYNIFSKGSWWLRSYGSYSNYACVVNSSGDISYYGQDCDYENYIRPAIWIDI